MSLKSCSSRPAHRNVQVTWCTEDTVSILGPKVVLDRWSHEDSRELVDRLQACQQLCIADDKLDFKTLVDDLAIVSKYTRLVNFVINDKLGKTMKLGYNFLNVHDCWPAHWNMAGDTGEGIRLLSPMYYLDMDAVRAGDGWPNPVDLGARLADSMLDPGSPNQITADSRGYYYWSGMMANFAFEDYLVKFFLCGYYARFTKFKAEAQPAADKEILGIVSEALEPQAHSILAADLPWAQ